MAALQGGPLAGIAAPPGACAAPGLSASEPAAAGQLRRLIALVDGGPGAPRLQSDVILQALLDTCSAQQGQFPAPASQHDWQQQQPPMLQYGAPDGGGPIQGERQAAEGAAAAAGAEPFSHGYPPWEAAPQPAYDPAHSSRRRGSRGARMPRAAAETQGAAPDEAQPTSSAEAMMWLSDAAAALAAAGDGAGEPEGGGAFPPPPRRATGGGLPATQRRRTRRSRRTRPG
eukprot:TRINITY_DN7968_c0_g1_i1.p2 TRINITY_DN7968_c0_g1~~TRINITY_DN7968_c0_g1_i1.p2  ORF type:complete len:229 (+),score=39.92 TRINITY_DN7968_c0_g1_i1:97-783(+)